MSKQFHTKWEEMQKKLGGVMSAWFDVEHGNAEVDKYHTAVIAASVAMLEMIELTPDQQCGGRAKEVTVHQCK